MVFEFEDEDKIGVYGEWEFLVLKIGWVDFEDGLWNSDGWDDRGG